MLVVFGVAAIIALAVLALTANVGTMAVAGIIGLPVAYAVARRPKHLLGLTVALHYWGSILPGFFTPFKIALSVLTIEIMVVFIITRQLRAPPRAFGLAFATLLIAVVTREVTSDYGLDMVHVVDFLGTTAVYMAMVQFIVNRKSLKLFMFYQVANLAAIDIWVLREVSWQAMMAGSVRASGPMGQANGLGDFVALHVPYALAIVADRTLTRLARALALGTFVFGLYTLFAAASRAGTISFLVGILVLVLLARGSLVKRFGLLGAALSLVVVVSAVAPTSFRDRVIGTFTGETKMKDVSNSRLDHSRLAAKMIADRPFVGHGTGGFYAWRQVETRGAVNEPPHSSALVMATGYGVPLAVFYFAILIGVITQSYPVVGRWRTDATYGRALIAAACGTLVSSLSAPGVFGLPTWLNVLLLSLVPGWSQPDDETADDGAALRAEVGPAQLPLPPTEFSRPPSHGVDNHA